MSADESTITENLAAAAARAVFPQVRRGGLDEEAVRAFRDWVADKAAVLEAQRDALQDEVRRLRTAPFPRPAGDGQNGLEGDGAPVQAVHILSRAQKTADGYVANAQQYSREMAEDARRRYDEVLRDAQVRASMILQEAESRAGDAADAARAAAPPSASPEERDLEAQIAYLRAFSTVCRTHLRAYLASLAASVEDWERAEESAAAGRGQLRLEA